MAFALANAPSLSTIVFLGAGPYPAITFNRPGVHLKLISGVPAFTDLVNLRPTTLTAAQLEHAGEQRRRGQGSDQ